MLRRQDKCQLQHCWITGGQGVKVHLPDTVGVTLLGEKCCKPAYMKSLNFLLPLTETLFHHDFPQQFKDSAPVHPPSCYSRPTVPGQRTGPRMWTPTCFLGPNHMPLIGLVASYCIYFGIYKHPRIKGTSEEQTLNPRP